MTVGDVMTTHVLTVQEDASYHDVVNILLQKKITGIPVVDSQGRLCGIISEKDLFHSLFPSPEEFYGDMAFYKNYENIEHDASKISDMCAGDIMTKEVVTVSPQHHVLVACSLIAVHHVRRLPVVDEEKLVGIVTTNNLYRNYLSKFFGGE